MKIVLSLSGGMDSAALLGTLLGTGHEVFAVSFFYGSKHNQYELEAARKLADRYGIKRQSMDISGIFAGFKSALLKEDSRSIPEGHYEDRTMVQTVVPGRNMIFSAILAGLAQSFEYDAVALGIHAGDHVIYPDCRPVFKESMDLAIKTASEYSVSLYAPFLGMNKGDIVKVGMEHKVPFELTRTCYKDQSLSCGKCGSCTERLLAFAENGLIDPIQYAE